MALLLAGCAALPQNAEEFRRAVPDGLLPGDFRSVMEAVEVDRPLRDVAAVFRERAPRCLDRSVSVTVRIITEFQEIFKTYETTFKPTVVVAQDRAELHLQAYTKGELHPLSRVPEGGTYRLVVDAYPLDGGRTRLQWFGLPADREVLFGAIKGWATGERATCPDLAKVRVSYYQ